MATRCGSAGTTGRWRGSNAATLAVQEEFVTRVAAFRMSDAGDAMLVYGGIGGLARVDKSTGAVAIVNARDPGDDIAAEDIGAPTSADGRVWAATLASGHLVELDPVSLEPIAALQIGITDVPKPGGRRRCAVGGGHRQHRRRLSCANHSDSLISRIEAGEALARGQCHSPAGLLLAALPRPRIIASGVAAALAAVLALASLLRPASPNLGPQTTPTPESSAQLLDQLPSAGEVVNVRQIPFRGFYPRLLAHGYLWLEDEDSGELMRVDPATSAIDVLAVAGRFAFGLNVTADETSVWALDAPKHQLVEIDPESLTEVRRVRTRAPVLAFVVAGGVAWFIDELTYELVRLDLSSETIDRRVALPGPSQLLDRR